MTGQVDDGVGEQVGPVDDPDGALAAVAGSLGRTLLGARRFHSEATGEGFTTGHEVRFGAPDGAVEDHIVYVETRPRGSERPGVLLMRDEDSGDSVAVWIYPGDPELPALPAAVFPASASVLLSRLGLDAAGVSLRVIAYRPGKRAVVRIETAARTIYLKVVRPTAAAPVRGRHELWRASGLPVPRVLGWAPDGLVALEALVGVEAITAVPQLADDLLDEEFLDAVDALTARIATVPSTTPARASLVERTDWYERRLAARDPDTSPELARIHGRIAAAVARGGRARPVTVHGDLHLAQLFVLPERPTAIIGVLDIDTAGLGDPADDAAAMVAHLIVTAEHYLRAGQPALAERARSLSHRARRRWAASDDPGLAARASAIGATHLLAHALAGSISTADAVRLADSLLAAHEHESALTPPSRASHGGTRAWE